MEKLIQKLKILKWNFVAMVLSISGLNFIICYLNTRDTVYLIISTVIVILSSLILSLSIRDIEKWRNEQDKK